MTPAQILYDEMNANNRMEHVDCMIVVLRTAQGNYFCMQSSNADGELRDMAQQMISEAK